MVSKFIENSNLYRLMISDNLAACSVETFRATLVEHDVDVVGMDAFFESCETLGTWDLEMIAARPKILSWCCFIGIENVRDLILSYGVHCQSNNIELVYFDREGPVLGGVVQEVLVPRMCNHPEVYECAEAGHTVCVLTFLKMKIPGWKVRAPGENDADVTARVTRKLTRIMECAVDWGQMEIVEHLQRAGCPCEERAGCAAAASGEISILERFIDSGLELTEKIMSSAAKHDQVETMEWLRARGCPFGRKTFTAAATGGMLEAVKWLENANCQVRPGIIDKVVQAGKLEVFAHLIGRGYHVDNTTFEIAVSSGHLNIVKYLCQNAFPRHQLQMELAAKHGKMDILKYLETVGYVADYNTLKSAAASPHDTINCFRYLYEAGLARPVKKQLLYQAALAGNMDVVKYLHEKIGASEPPDCGILHGAVQSGNLELIKFLYERGYPVDQFTVHLINNSHSGEVREYIRIVEKR